MIKGSVRDVSKLVDDWLEMAYDAMEVAHPCYAHKHLLFTAHTCQQSLEKALKAAVQNIGVIPPHTHRLEKLAQQCDIWDLLTHEQQDLLIRLSGLYLATRYPDVKAAKNKDLTDKSIKKILSSSKEVLSVICRHVRNL